MLETLSRVERHRLTLLKFCLIHTFLDNDVSQELQSVVEKFFEQYRDQAFT